jgi:signal transduction histidine kinase
VPQLLLCPVLILAATAAAPPPVVVDAGFDRRVLGRHLELLRDVGQRLDARALLRGEHDDAFRPAPHDENGLGYTADALWVRFAIDNRAGGPLPLLLELGYAPLDHVELTLAGPDGSVREWRSGDLLAFADRPYPARTHVFPLTVEPGASTVLLRAASSSPLNVPLALFRPATFARRTEVEGVLLWMFYGLLSGLILYNLFLFSSVRDPSYLYYTAYIACFGLFLLCHNGLAKRYLWPGPGDWNHQVMIAAAYAATVTAVQFSRCFLDTRRTLPRLDRVLRALQLLGVGGLLVFLVAYVGVLERAGVMLLVVVSLLLLASGAAVWRQGSRHARFYVLAWTTLLLGIAAGLLKALGWLPITFWTTWGYQIAAAVEAVLLSLALADRIHDLRAQTERLNAALAGKVEERTRSLELTSSHLREEVSGRIRAEDERNQLQAQLLQAQKMEAIGRLAGGVAHDINNVLGAIMGFASLATDATTAEHPVREDLAEILAAAARGRDLTNNLLGFARRSAQVQRACDLNELTLEVQHLLERTALKRVRLEHALHPTPLRVLGDASELSQAIMNLCVNALDASTDEGSLLLSTDVAA